MYALTPEITQILILPEYMCNPPVPVCVDHRPAAAAGRLPESRPGAGGRARAEAERLRQEAAPGQIQDRQRAGTAIGVCPHHSSVSFFFLRETPSVPSAAQTCLNLPAVFPPGFKKKNTHGHTHTHTQSRRHNPGLHSLPWGLNTTRSSCVIS